MTEIEQLENQIRDTIQKYVLKDTERESTTGDLLDMLDDVIDYQKILLDLYKNQNKILDSHNKIFFNSIKKEIELFERTPFVRRRNI